MESIIGVDGAGAGQAPGGLIKNSSEQDFTNDVIQASMEAPIVVDFWAPWCGPCKQLGPALEKAVTEAGGAVRMVKINVDENQGLSGQLRIQSIPTVYAFYQGQPVDGFQGALPDSEIKAFITRLIDMSGGQSADPISQALEQAEAALKSDQVGEAAALYGQILQHEPENTAALAGLVSCHLAGGELDQARSLFDSIPEETRKDEAFVSVIAQLELAEQATAAGPVTELMEKVAQNHNDHQARFDLAMALQAAEKPQAAADELLEIVRRDRAWNEDAARKQLLTFFEAWGPTDPLTVETRKQLSSILFS